MLSCFNDVARRVDLAAFHAGDDAAFEVGQHCGSFIGFLGWRNLRQSGVGECQRNDETG